jgi:CDP-diacylglycerol---serine O-phosphatidyltransferase
MKPIKPSLRLRKRQAIYVIPNLFTTGNLFCGLYAVIASFDGHYLNAASAIVVALIFDVLDGQSARLTKTTSQFGIEYDSLADLISFGLAPAVLIYAWALHAKGVMGLAVVFAFVGCGALRLARYNVQSITGDNRYFTGLPIPGAASVLASLVIFDHHIFQLGQTVKPVMVLVVTFLLSFLMVSTIKYAKFRAMKLNAGEGFVYLVWGVLGIMLIAAMPPVALFTLFAGYAVSGVIMWLMGLARPSARRPIPQERSSAASLPPSGRTDDGNKGIGV